MSEGMAAATAAAAAPAADTYLSILGAAALVALSGLFSGLNLGLMSFTEDDLRVIIEGSTDADEIAHAQAIRPIRARGNLLLCTLLLGNTLVNAVIAVLLSDLTSGLIGTLVTVRSLVTDHSAVEISPSCGRRV